MKISLSSGNYNIVDSNQIFLFDETKEFKIDILTDDNFQFSMIFKFQKDVLGKQEIKKEVVNNQITFICTNFDDMGTGLSVPANIAKIGGKEYFLMFWSYVDGGEDKPQVRSIKYTIYSEI